MGLNPREMKWKQDLAGFYWMFASWLQILCTSKGLRKHSDSCSISAQDHGWFTHLGNTVNRWRSRAGFRISEDCYVGECCSSLVKGREKRERDSLGILFGLSSRCESTAVSTVLRKSVRFFLINVFLIKQKSFQDEICPVVLQTVNILSEWLRRLLGVVIPKHFPGKQQKVLDTPHPCTFTFTLSQSSLNQSLDNIINY